MLRINESKIGYYLMCNCIFTVDVDYTFDILLLIRLIIILVLFVNMFNEGATHFLHLSIKIPRWFNIETTATKSLVLCGYKWLLPS